MNKIKNAGNVLLNIINDILDFSKIEAGELTVIQKSFLIKGLLKNIVDIYEMQFYEKEVKFQSVISPNVPDAVYNDKLRINQLLINLLTNALKFTEKGKVDLYIDYQQEKDLVIFKVKDTGIGIDPRNLDRIFDPFIQLDDSRIISKEGTGLGLAICRKLAQLIGGSLSVSSTFGKGTEFTLEIPANSTKVKSNFSEDLNTEKTETGLDEKKGNKILIAEDNIVNMELLLEQLKDAGFNNLITAVNGKEAVEMAKKHSPDLVLMDNQMPVMNGNEAIALIKKDGYKGPIIMLSAYAMRDEIDKSFEIGVADYITKPINFEIFFDQIAVFLNKKETASSVL